MAKLTLSVDGKVVDVAKKYAALRGTSVSRLVQEYLRLISRVSPTQEGATPPILARWRGALKGSRVDVGDYRRYLERKYL
jgi:hypothetical protein